MKINENTQASDISSDILLRMLTDETDGEEFTRAFLKSGFLSSAVDALFYARRQAGLTQAQVAELMKTKQAAIARLEADTEGSMSLHRYVEFALACGVVPLNITLAPVRSVRDWIIDSPESPRTANVYNTWIKNYNQSVPLSSITVQGLSDFSFSLNEAATAFQSIQMRGHSETYLLEEQGQKLPQSDVATLTSTIQGSSVVQSTAKKIDQKFEVAA